MVDVAHRQRVTAAITTRLPDLPAAQAELAATAAMAAVADSAAGMAVAAIRTRLAQTATRADAEATTAHRGHMTVTGQWRPSTYEQSYPHDAETYRLRHEAWAQVAAWLRGEAGQLNARYSLTDTVALQAVTDYLTLTGASARVHEALDAARVWQTQRVYRDTTYTQPRQLAGRDIHEHDQVAHTDGHPTRMTMRRVIELGRAVTWLPVDRIPTPEGSRPGVQLPGHPLPHLIDPGTTYIVRIPAAHSAALQ